MELMWILELISLFDRTLNPLLLLLWYLILWLKLGFLFKLNPRDLDFAYLITMLKILCVVNISKSFSSICRRWSREEQWGCSGEQSSVYNCLCWQSFFRGKNLFLELNRSHDCQFLPWSCLSAQKLPMSACGGTFG